MAAALRPGVNVVGVLVRFYGEPTAWWMPAVPTFSHGAGVLVAEVDLPGGVLGTDRTWRCRVSDAWTRQRPSGLGRPARRCSTAAGSTRTGCGRATRTKAGRRPAWSPRCTSGASAGRSRPTDPYGPMPPRVTAPRGRDAEDPGRAAAAPARHAR
ncbi:hypothetical protein [Micromonospora sp. b486]|uniref:hypothetical protein n=1 Tax=Micromonospora sp. b486 TaxID=3053986 RepID=UPI00259CA32E|nr:hypothetical protein [Micromonospora sp. b486]MDM4784443.1 hypothetical protein [Micromonospora sp. b486]